MYFYKGFNPDSESKVEKEFDDEYEAIEFARDNVSEYPKYKVTDDDGELVDSNKMADDEEEATMDMMSPD